MKAWTNCSRWTPGWLGSTAARMLGILMLLWWAGGVAVAGVTNQLTELVLLNYTGYVIESDVLNGGAGYDRDSIAARGRATFTKVAGGTSSFEYTLRFFLVDSDGVKQPLSGGKGSVDVVSEVTSWRRQRLDRPCSARSSRT